MIRGLTKSERQRFLAMSERVREADARALIERRMLGLLTRELKGRVAARRESRRVRRDAVRDGAGS